MNFDELFDSSDFDEYLHSGDSSDPDDDLVKGGPGSGNFGHAGRPGEVGGSTSSGATRTSDGPSGQMKELPPIGQRRAWPGSSQSTPAPGSPAAVRQTLAAKQTNAMARPDFVLGFPDDTPDYEGARDFIAAYGQPFKAQKLPAGIEKGRQNECYRNASLLVMDNEDYDFVEGYADTPGLPFTFMHAWAVDKQGNVIDNTWENPEKSRYFGVRYNRAKYMKSLYKAKVYGVMSATPKQIKAALANNAKDLRDE